MNSSNDFSQNLYYLIKTMSALTISMKKIRTQTKFRNKNQIRINLRVILQSLTLR